VQVLSDLKAQGDIEHTFGSDDDANFPVIPETQGPSRLELELWVHTSGWWRRSGFIMEQRLGRRRWCGLFLERLGGEEPGRHAYEGERDGINKKERTTYYYT